MIPNTSRCLLLLVCGLLWFSGCASGESAMVEALPEEAESAPASTGPALDVFHLQDDSIAMTRLSDGRSVEIGEENGILFVRDAPDGARAILALEGDDMTRLVSVQRKFGRVFQLGAAPNGVRYTVAWNPEGTEAALGTDLSGVSGLSRGRIQRFLATEGRVQNVGCSASDTVLAWLPDGSLLVRGGDNLYVVDHLDCATLRTIDARKMHHVSVSADGAQMAWIQRELVYNRESRSYEPDSTLMAASTSGGEGLVVVDNRFKPRNMVWSDDGTELAFDVELEGGIRAVSIYSVASGQTSYLARPAAGGASQTDPGFSPSGSHVSYIEHGAEGKVLKVKRAGEPFARTVAAPIPSTMSWVTDDIILVMNQDGASLIRVETGETLQTQALQDILAAIGPVP